MATSPVSPGDVAKYRSLESHTIDLLLNAVPLQPVYSGVVGATPEVTPATEVLVSPTLGLSSLQVGQLVKIHAAGDPGTVKTWAIVSHIPIGSALYINPTTLGESLFPQGIEGFIEAGDELTVYSFEPIVGLYSTIRGGIFYKNWRDPYTDQNEAPPPVSNSGEWQAVKADPVTGLGRVTLPRKGFNTSYSIGSTIVTTLWSISTGSLVSGTLGDTVIVVDFPQGVHKVSQTCTDALGKTHTSHLWVWVNGDDFPDLGTEYKVEAIEGDSQGLSGRELSITISGIGLDYTRFLPMSGFILREFPKFGGQEVSSNVHVDSFVGYVTSMSFTHELETGVGRVEFRLSSAYLVAKDVQQPPQALIHDSNPSNWSQGSLALANPRGALYYAVKWHTPALMDWHDINPESYTDLPLKKTHRFDTNNLADAMRVAAEEMPGGVVGSRSDGTIVLLKDPTLQEDDFRNSTPVLWTVQERDVAGDVTYDKRFRSTKAQAITSASCYDGVNIRGFAAIRKWGQGTAKSTLKEFAVTPGEGLLRVREVVGHFIASENNEHPGVTLTLNRNLDMAEPVDCCWQVLDLEDRDINLSGRWLPVKVDRTWANTPGGWTKLVRVTYRKETRGQPGDELVFGSSESDRTGWNKSKPSPFKLEIESMPDVCFKWDDRGRLYRTMDYSAARPRYQDITDQLDTGITVSHCDWDFTSPYFEEGRDTGQDISLLVVYSKGVTLHVVRIQNVLAPKVQVVPLTTYVMQDDSCRTGANIRSSREVPGFVVVAWKDRWGTGIKQSYDGGDTWGLPEFAGFGAPGLAQTDSNAIDNAKIGLDVFDTYSVVAGRHSTLFGSKYTLWRDDGSAVYEEIPDSPESGYPCPVVRIVDFESIIAVDPRVYFARSNDFNDEDVGFVQGFGVTGDYATVEWDNPGWVKLVYSVPASPEQATFGYGVLTGSVVTRVHFRYRTNSLVFFEGGDLASVPPGIEECVFVGDIATGIVDYNPFVYYSGAFDSTSRVTGYGDGSILGQAYLELDYYNIEGHHGVGMLYRIDGWLDMSGVFNDISPDSRYPTGSAGISINVFTGVLEVVGFDGTDYKWYRSDDLGLSWTEIETTEAIGVLAFDDISILMEEDGSKVVVEWGTVREDKTGDIKLALDTGKLVDFLTGVEL